MILRATYQAADDPTAEIRAVDFPREAYTYEAAVDATRPGEKLLHVRPIDEPDEP